MNEFPTPWNFLTVDAHNKAYYERIASVNDDIATIEVGWFKVESINGVYKTVGDINIERRYVKLIGGLIKTLPFTDEMKKECERQRGRSTYQFGYGAHASGTQADKCKRKKRREYKW